MKKKRHKINRLFFYSFLIIVGVGLISFLQNLLLTEAVKRLGNKIQSIDNDVQHLKADLEKAKEYDEKYTKNLDLLSGLKNFKPLQEGDAWKEKENWELVKIGMKMAKVEEILGSPTSKENVRGSEFVYYYEGFVEGVGSTSGLVRFRNGGARDIQPPTFK